MKSILVQIASMLCLLTIVGCGDKHEKQNETKQPTPGEVVYMNPDGLHKNPAYSQVVVTTGPMKTIYVGGQNASDKEGKLVGKGDLKAQASQTLNNLKIALAAGGGSLNNVIKWNVYILQGQDAKVAFEALQEDLKKMPHPPVITGVYVAALAQPDFLLEMDAIAVVPE